jgi:hypothetical protein
MTEILTRRPAFRKTMLALTAAAALGSCLEALSTYSGQMPLFTVRSNVLFSKFWFLYSSRTWVSVAAGMQGLHSEVSRMIERVRRKRNPESQSKAVAPAQAPRWRLFGEPNILQGEDSAAYDELLARIYAAVKPVDTIEEMFTADIVARWASRSRSLVKAA